MIPLISAILYRMDGHGKGDGFLPFFPFNKLTSGGINYTRYLIGVAISLITGNWLYAITYAIAVSVPYGENSWLRERFGNRMGWFTVGFLFGLASLSWGNAFFCGFIFMLLMGLSNEGFSYVKSLNDGNTIVDNWYLDHAVLEFIFGGLGTVIYVIR